MPNPGENSRRLLLERERRVQLRTIAEFGKLRDRLQSDLDDLLRRIDIARLTTPNAPPNLVLEAARTRQLLDDVSDEMLLIARRLGMQTADAQTAAIRIAKKQAMDTANLNADFAFFDSEATKELIGITGAGQPLEKHFLKLSFPIREAMFDALFFGIAAGQSNQQIAAGVKEAIGGGTSAAMTIVRTETNRAYREATRKFYVDAPAVVGWRWVAACDLNTCPICWSQHGRIFKTRTKMATHPNCRCTMVAVFKTDAKAPTGDDLFRDLTPAQQKAILGPKRFELYKAGARLTDFVELTKTKFGPGRRIKPLAITTIGATPPAAIPPPKPPAKPKSAVTPKPTLPAATIPTFESTAAADQWFAETYPQTVWDFKGIDTEGGFMQNQANEIDRLFREYPAVAARMKYFGTGITKAKRPFSIRFGKQTYAQHQYYPNGKYSYISLNPKYYSNREVMRAAKVRNFASGWHVSDRDHATVSHEFGHAVELWIDSDLQSKQITKFGRLSGEDEIGSIKNNLVTALKPEPGEQSGYSLALMKRNKRAAEASRRKEQFAEGFSMIQNQPPVLRSRFARSLNTLLEILKSGSYNSDAKTMFDAEGEAEKKAARIAINELHKKLGLPEPFDISE